MANRHPRCHHGRNFSSFTYRSCLSSQIPLKLTPKQGHAHLLPPAITLPYNVHTSPPQLLHAVPERRSGDQRSNSDHRVWCGCEQDHSPRRLPPAAAAFLGMCMWPHPSSLCLQGHILCPLLIRTTQVTVHLKILYHLCKVSCEGASIRPEDQDAKIWGAITKPIMRNGHCVNLYT